MVKDIASTAIKELQGLKDKDIIQNSILADELDNVISRLKDKSFRLAVVGEFSSGKSTFLNAILKKDLLKHGAVETTATLTQIDNIAKGQNDDTFDVQYNNGKEEKNLPIEKLQDYTITSSKVISVADEVKKVVLRTHIFDVDYPVSLIDTPGLNGVADNHREKTLNEIKNAHACIYLLQVRGVNKSDADFIKYLSEYQKNILFVQNFIDELHDLEGETPEQKIAAQRKILEEIFKDSPDVNFDILGVSARNALIAQDKKAFPKYSDEERKELMESSRFETLLAEVQRLIKENLRAKKQQKDAIQVALRILDQMHDIAEIKIEQQKTDALESGQYGKVKYYTLLEEKLQKNKDKYIKNIKNYVSVEASDLKRISDKKVVNYLEEFRDEIEKGIDDKLQSDLRMRKDELADFVYNGELSRKISQSIYKVSQDLNVLLSSGLQNIQDGAMMRIEEYLGGTKVAVKTEWGALPKIVETDDTSILKDGIKDKEREIEELKSQNNQIETEQRQLIDECKQNRLEMDEERGKLDNLKIDYDQKIFNLGSKPRFERKQVTKTREIKRGGLFGGILDFFGTKTETYTETVTNSKERNKWINKRNKIEQEYFSKQEQVNLALANLNMKQQMLKDRSKELSGEQDRIRAAIKAQESRVKNEKELLEVQRNKARREHLNNIKKIAIKQLTEHFNTVSENLRINIASMLSDGEQTITTKALNIFNERFTERLNEIKRSLSEDKNTINENKLNIDRAVIEKVMRNLEELV
ncbi:dynamin family protein [Ligilactobacillus faecis]|uniref:Dynamin family protein n=1 Tax=Ligilactobacillus faecis TaxID=762833 RepID=A0ABV4DR83_9LACO